MGATTGCGGPPRSSEAIPKAGASAQAPRAAGPVLDAPPSPSSASSKQPAKLELTFERLGSAPSLQTERVLVQLRSESLSDSPGAARLAIDSAPSGSQVWVSLNGHMPRVVPAPGVVPLSDLLPELTEPSEGTQRILAYAGKPSDCEALVVQELEVQAGDAKPPEADTSARVRLFSPYGTFNGQKAARSVRLCFSSTDTSRRLRVSGPGGQVLVTTLAPGQYAVHGLLSGDYRFDWVAAGPAEAVTTDAAGASTITVNLDAPGSAD